MADAGLQAPAVPIPQAPQVPQQSAQQDQYVPQLIGHILSQNFQESHKEMQK